MKACSQEKGGIKVIRKHDGKQNVWSVNGIDIKYSERHKDINTKNLILCCGQKFFVEISSA